MGTREHDDADQAHYVFLMRHELHDDGVLKPEAPDAISGVANALADWLLVHDIDIEVAHMGGSEVVDTTRILVDSTISRLSSDGSRSQRLHRAVPDPASAVESRAWRWGPLSAVPRAWLPPFAAPHADPRVDKLHDLCDFHATRPNRDRMARVREWLQGSGRDSDRPAGRMLVGNDPPVSWMSTELGGDGALAHGELVCLRQEDRGGVATLLTRIASTILGRPLRPPPFELIWSAAPRDHKQVQPIVDKVRSKMTTAASIGTVITGLLVFLLRSEVNLATWWFWGALMAFSGSAILYFAALFHLDSLSMPKRFWSAGGVPKHRANGQRDALDRLRSGWGRLERPPSSAARVLKDAMVHTWTWMFLPATVLAGVGVAFLLGMSAHPPPTDPQLLRLDVGKVIVVLAWFVTVAMYAAAHRPNLGTSD